MRRGAIVGLCLGVGLMVLPGLGLGPGISAASATTWTIAVSGDGVGMYPTFDPTIHRYAITTTSATNGTVTVTVPPGSTLDGVPTSGPVPVTGLVAGDEIAVGTGGASYGLIYLPNAFPTMTATGTATFTGSLGVGLTTFGSAPGEGIEALLDRNGVPAWFLDNSGGNDLKRQPNGELTVMRPTASGADGFTGSDLVTLDPQLHPTVRRHIATPLHDTDNHDSQRLADGSTILIGYEPRGPVLTGYLDATIQKLDPAGNVVFQWSSAGLEAETLNPLLWPQASASARIDYAHINSVQEIPDGTHDLLVSFRHFSSVYRIATQDHGTYHSGDIVWRLGGRHSSFTFAAGDGGPCAQHNATWIGPDRVLLFDNGSTLLGQSAAGCVNPLDPLGPGIARPYTRVSEYVLDTSAGTATLDWSYVPAGTFTFFAGSATRLADGDTLMGWASDRTTLATEVDHGASPAPVWSLAVAGNTQSVGYTSYRVSVVPYTDRTAPVVTLDQVDGASYFDDQAPRTPQWTCTDRGGSTLAGCAVAGLVGGHLSPSPGSHTVSVTATDGAGNTTVVARHYTVRPAQQPDGLVRKGGRTWWKGADVYGPATDQTVRQSIRRTHAGTAYWRVQNDGERADTFRLTGTAGTSRYRVHYFAGSTEVTRAVVAGTYRTGILAPGRWTALRVEITPTRRSHVGAERTLVLRAHSVTDATAVDRVATEVTVRR